MKKQLIDYIPFYLGEDLISYWGVMKEVDTIKGFAYPRVILSLDDDDIQASVDLSIKSKKGLEPKLLLRPLSDMTEEEGKYIVEKYSFRSVDMPMNKRLFGIEIAKRLSEQMDAALYLTSRGFDIFGLIEAGLAIDKTLK